MSKRCVKKIHYNLIVCLLMLAVNFHASTLNADTGNNLSAELTLQGEKTQGSMLIGHVPLGAQVWLNDKNIAVTPQGEFVLGFGRDAALKQTLTWRVNSGSKHNKTIRLVKRHYDEQRITGVPQKMVIPDKSKLARIKSEVAMVKQARQTNSKLTYFLKVFKKPIEGPVSGVYGSRRIFNGTPKRPHFGVDYAAPIGTLVMAPVDGIVTLANDDMYYSGGTLIIDHGYGVSSTYIHLSKVLVKEGQRVKQGEAIAKVGKRGRATGPHLDWRINWFNVRLDPQLVIKLNSFKKRDFKQTLN